MKISDESIFASTFRSFFKGIFGMIGIALGMIPFLIILGMVFSDDDTDLPTTTKKEMVPNADGTRKPLAASGPVILKINVTGVIGDPKLNQESIAKILQESREGDFKDNRVKALVLYINSPGGTVFDSDSIYRAIKEYKERYKIPVYAYVDGLCASGAVYIASAADHVSASGTSIIGSVGVILQPFFNFSDLMEKHGVKAKTITAGKGKDMMNATRPWVEGEEKNFVDITTSLYDRFIDIVVSARKGINKDALVKDYGAGVFSAALAQQHGYIDEIEESFSQFLQKVVEEAKIDKDTYQVVELQKKYWIQDLFGSEETPLGASIQQLIQHYTSTRGLDSAYRFQFLYLYHPSFEMAQTPQ